MADMVVIFKIQYRIFCKISGIDTGPPLFYSIQHIVSDLVNIYACRKTGT